MKISISRYKIKAELEKGLLKSIIKKDTIYFLSYGRLNLIKISINRYGEKIEALGYELADTGDMYFQHLFDRYPDHYNELVKTLK